MNSNTISKKLFGIGVVSVLCLVASFLVLGVVSEREYRFTEAKNEIATLWGASQEVLGPVLVFEKENVEKENEYTYVLPEKLTVHVDIEPEIRSRGVFDTIVYTEKVRVDGVFSTSDFPNSNFDTNPKLIVSLTDTRSIEKQVVLTWGSEEILFSPGTSESFFGESGMHAPVSNTRVQKEIPFSFELTLRGSGEGKVVPVGEETIVTMSSPWKSPEFIGAFLPTEREVSEVGFTAQWKVSSFSRSYPQTWSGVDFVNKEILASSAFGVNLYERVQIYTLVERSVKYAVLFILITFTAFFLFETLGKVRVHPIQYLLIGSSLALFYLLLLSFTEQIGFFKAYTLSSSMIVLLITLFSFKVVKQKLRTFIVCSMLTLLYVYMYFVLQLEEYALMFGSLLVFVLLASVMYLTRNMDWYSSTRE